MFIPPLEPHSLGLYTPACRSRPDGSDHCESARLPCHWKLLPPPPSAFTCLASDFDTHLVSPRQIAFGVIASWTRTIYHQFELLAGKSAPHDFIQLLIYKAMTFSDEIEKVDTVRAYHVRVTGAPVPPIPF